MFENRKEKQWIRLCLQKKQIMRFSLEKKQKDV